MLKIILRLMMYSAVLLQVFACGSGGGGSTAFFERGYVDYSVAPVNTLITTTAVDPPVTDAASTVTLTVTNTQYNTTTNPSSYLVKGIAYKYTRVDNSSIVVTRAAAETSMPADGSAAIPFILSRADVIDELVQKHGFSIGNMPQGWRFYVTANFAVRENMSGKEMSYSNVNLGEIIFR